MAFIEPMHRNKPNITYLLVTAPTGVAAFNVNGMTIHSALLLKIVRSRSWEPPLSFEKLNTLISKWKKIMLIIDEISKVRSEMSLDIHRRWKEIKGTNVNGIWFGNTCVLACGDLHQLPPVQQLCKFKPVKDAMAKRCGSGSILVD